jgi:hypothetical protein
LKRRGFNPSQSPPILMQPNKAKFVLGGTELNSYSI